MGFGNHQPEPAKLAETPQQRAWHEAVALPGVAMRLDLARDEAPHLLAQKRAFRRVVYRRPHRRIARRAGCVVACHRAGHIRNTPNVVRSTGRLSEAEMAIASTRRVSTGSMMPSSQIRALAKYGCPSCS